MLALAIGIGLFRLGADLRRHDRASARRRAWAILQVSLLFAGSVIMLATQTHGYRLAMALVMVSCGVQLLRGWTPLKAYIDGEPPSGTV